MVSWPSFIECKLMMVAFLWIFIGLLIVVAYRLMFITPRVCLCAYKLSIWSKLII